jgi:hypothetical protein
MIPELIEKAKRFLFHRQYCYRQTFKGPLAQVVLADLARFCRATESTFDPNERTHALLEGRREVWLRLSNQLQLTPDQLWSLFSQAGIQSED